MRRVLLLTVFCFSCPEQFDNGFLGNLHPAALPMAVVSDGTIAPDILLEATDWWNEQIGATVFFLGEDAGEVKVSEGSLPGGEMGLASLQHDDDGNIYFVDITISYDFAYHRPTVVQVLKHELGHCLGLADDGQSLDLGSIMSQGSPRGNVTEADRARIRGLLE